MSESAVEIRPLRALGEALLRLADRARVNAGVEPFDETMHVFVEAMMDAFATADARGSVCVSLWEVARKWGCLLYTSPSPRDRTRSRMPSSA